MIVYNTAKLTKPMSDRVLKLRGQDGWILGGVAQSVGNLPESTASGHIAYPTIYHYHFWKKKERS